MRFLLLLSFMGLTWCSPRKVPPPPANVASAQALKTASDEQQSKASAAVGAATVANAGNPDGSPKAATAGELSVAAANLPSPTDKDRAEALARVNVALKGDLENANREWDKARGSANELTAKVAELESRVAQERARAALEIQRQIQQAHDEAAQQAKAKEKTMLTAIFFGGGALLIAASVAILFLAGSVPIFGPKAAIAVGGAGMALILTGVLIRAINNFIEAHPLLFWTSLILAIVGAAASVAFMVANHHHTKTGNPQ